MKKSLIFILLLITNGYTQYSAPPVIRYGPINTLGGGLWNWEQRLDVRWDNIIENGDFTYWPFGTDTIPYGASHTYAEVNQDVSRESSNIKIGSYAMRITANGTNAYTDYRPTFRKEWKNRYISVGFWYYCPSANDQTQTALVLDDTRNSFINLTQDNAWHWGHIVFVVDNEATLVAIRFSANNTAVSDTDDYIIIDGLTMQLGRIATRWCYSYWDMFYKFGLYYDGTNYGFGDTSPTSKWSFNNTMRIETSAPQYQIRESDQDLDIGLYRIVVDGTNFRIDRNTHATTEFSTYTQVALADTNNYWTIAMNTTAVSASDGRFYCKQGASEAPDTLFIYINSKWQKFVGTVNNP